MGQNTRKDPRAKVLSMTVRYRSATLGEFIEHHSYDVSRGGMFIKTPSPFPAGTLLKFEVKIAEEQRVMQGVGRVVWKRDVAQPDGEPSGMGIKFIKIDEASKAVIERLLESRGGGTLGAFDRTPEGSGMFPGTLGLSLPPPEDRTIMKPANELLDEALRKTGEEAAPVSAPSASGFQAVAVAPASLGPVAPMQPETADSDAPPAPASARIPSLESLDKTQRSPIEPAGKSAAQPAANDVRRSATGPLHVEEEGGGGRALFLFLAVAAVAAGIWILTKKSGPPELTPPPAPEMEKPAEPLIAPSAPLVEPPPVEAAPEPSPTSSADVSPVPAPEPTVSAAPSPTAAPVVKKPKPTVVAPKVPVAPAAEPSSAAPAPSVAPAPTSAPSSPPAVKPVPAPAAPPAENPY